ncbi:restriction endonuclease subunit S [Staphylococcus hominis]|uniref:restriction endonuclease subunit S n=1 Tax=Staphylococcus hominis TaxID=1290 RepID=UPI00066ADBAC|nr:restriction endonuclease subunit S [Staphylococcus hominis]MBC3066860.1 restriction endonuclease subunit S [Staphylococcus hominis]MBC3073337.1 restriction endonuclease subunit S [Staphylococcus hominis]
MTEHTNTPELRFPGFKDEWKLQKLGNLAQFSKGKSLSKKDLNINGNPCILYGELYTKYGAILNKVYSKTSTQNDSLVFSKRNQILIPSSGETDIDIATATAIDTDVKIAIGGDLNIITPINSDGRFISLYINGKGKYNLAKYAQGKSVVHLYNSDIKKLNFYLPTNMAEQKKIGDFFSKLDQQIELEEKKLELLEQQKKGYMQKIFSQELRFKDENGNKYPKWTNTLIKDLFINKGGTALEKEFENNGDYKVISIGSYSMNSTYNDQNLRINKNEKTEKYILSQGDLAMVLNDKTKDGNIIGRSIFIDKDNHYIYNQRTERLIPLNENDNKFLWFLMNTDIVRNKIKSMMQGATQVYINYSSIKNISLQIPSFEEQIKIREFLEILLHSITKQDNKVKLLKQRKQGLLQKMFV